MHDHLLHHLLKNSAGKYPHKSAVVYKNNSLTYSELEKQSSELALRLTGMGIISGDRVGIMHPKSVETIVALFAILKTGAVYVPIDPSAPVSRIEYMIRHCGIECLVAASGDVIRLLDNAEESLPVNKVIVIGGSCDALKHRSVGS